MREFGRIDEANKLLESAIDVRAFEKDALTRKYYFTYEQLSDEEVLARAVLIEAGDDPTAEELQKAVLTVVEKVLGEIEDESDD